ANRQADEETREQRWLKFVTYIAIVSGVIASIFLDGFYLLAILIAAIGMWEIIRRLSASSSRLFQLFVLGVYTVIALSFVYFSIGFGQSFLLFIYFQVFTFDGFSQIAGQLLGRQKLLPQISPGKTVEGLIGGTLLCLMAAVLARNWVAFSMPKALLIGGTTALLAFTGDMLASYLKRQFHIKDYSNLLPGHGGFLDRFDSLMMVGIGYSLLSQIQPLQ
ncbi:MAG: phosphatidate cytidylyltransferase, partial [Leptolyngbyaceae cyanobacterium MO_188.B28]|nr:phosphatidate cytidylyltransferase [Leptolyngbyaceae cyanobacterium MO_188.B28]